MEDNLGNRISHVNKLDWLTVSEVRKSFPSSLTKLEDLIQDLSISKSIQTIPILKGEKERLLIHRSSLDTIKSRYSNFRKKEGKTRFRKTLQGLPPMRMAPSAFAEQAKIMAERLEQLEEALKSSSQTSLEATVNQLRLENRIALQRLQAAEERSAYWRQIAEQRKVS